MIVIRKITRMRDYGVFRDFAWPQGLPEFGRYNLIYGWNGTGKTMLSRLFRYLEKRQNPTMGKLSVKIGDMDYSERQFEMCSMPVRVFNCDFVAETVFNTNGEVAPIFIIGERNVEKQKKVDKLRSQLKEDQKKLDKDREKLNEVEGALDRFCIDRARHIKDTLRTSGSSPYNDYDKRRYKERAEKMVADGDAAAHLLSEGERDALLAQHQETPKPEIEEVSYTLPSLQQLADVVSALLQETVVSATIKALKDDPALAGWTRKGLSLHKGRNSKKCLFCGQPLPTGRLEALEVHFSAEYEGFLAKLDEQIRQLQNASDQAAGVELPDSARLYADLVTEYDEAKSAVRKALERVHEFLEVLIRELNDKKARPFDRMTLDAAVPPLDADVVDRLNVIIRKHNQTCDDFQSRIAEARERLALHMIAAELEEFVQLKDAVRQAYADVKTAEQEVQRLTEEIKRLEREIVEHREPAERLNEDLQNYLGHSELRLEVEKTGYQITRAGEIATGLSEGERTAIALLYFLRSLEDRRFDLETGVVVLDDPVSSLDANALFSASGFIRERTQNAGQLFILTHNFTFFRQVRNWFHQLKGQNKNDVNLRPARFFMLDCSIEHDSRCTKIQRLDPLLERYESEYHYLFAYVYRAAMGGLQTGLQQNYLLPNVARRLLEAFLAFRQPQKAGELWQQMKYLDFDEAKKMRILRFLHTHSHHGEIGEPEHDLSLLSEAPAVLKDLLGLMKSEDEKHFQAMESLVTAHNQNENETN